MMFGFRDVFHYLECYECGCLSLLDIPEDMARYYPQQYYAEVERTSGNPFIDFLIRRRIKSIINGPSLLGSLMTRLHSSPVHHLWMGKIDIKLDSRLIDIGCRYGHFLGYLKREGFKDLTGVDPYIDEDKIPDDLRIMKKEIFDIVNEEFDVATYRHSMEHVTRPLEVLKQTRKILRENGYCIIETPVADSYAWREFRENWVQLDPPRHIHVFSKKGMELLAAESGFRVLDVIFSSNEFQFWGSIQYQNDIPLYSERSYGADPDASIFSSEDIKRFRQEAEALNQRNSGDQAIFILQKNGARPPHSA